ncbi:MAG TPA: hypothetical protein VHW66_21845 [Stellaceae bacterium]|nr:hypothetical protein [Stellaceae bacterium]
MTSKLDRQNINRALAKAIAYHDCGKPEKAKAWAVQLMRELQARDLVVAEWRDTNPEG